jgi:hypothetical protein
MNLKEENKLKIKEKIAQFRKKRIFYKNRNLTVVKRSDKIYQALGLPKVLNLNPRSIYNKIDEFCSLNF